MLVSAVLCLLSSWLGVAKGIASYTGDVLTNDPSVAHTFGYQVAMWGTSRMAATAIHAKRRVFIYDYVSSAWSQSYMLEKSEWAADKQMSLAFQSSDCLFATSYYGSVYAYRLVSGSWSLESTMTTPTINNAHTIAVSGNNVLIGDGDDAASVYYYTYSGTTWSLVQTLVGIDLYYGMGVAIDGDVAMISAGGGALVYVYSLTNGFWTEQSEIAISYPGAVAFDNEAGLGVIGSNNLFYTMVKTPDSYNWAVDATYKHPLTGDIFTSFGYGVAMSGTTVMVSASQYPRKREGQVYFYNLFPPTDAPTVSPSSPPSLNPTEKPSAKPTEAPTALPSTSLIPTSLTTVSPSESPTTSMPTYPNTHPPSVQPTVVPTLSQWPTMLPTVVPSVVPSPAVSMVPSAAPSNTKKPTMIPTRKPTRVGVTNAPTVLPTLASVAISFNSDIYLHNVSASILDTASQTAVTGAVADTLSLPSNQVSVVSQASVGTESGHRLLTATPHYQVKVVVKVDASTRDYASATNQDGAYLYTLLKTTLVDAVNTQSFASSVRQHSRLVQATATLFVGQVNVTLTGNYSVIPLVLDDDQSPADNHHNDLSRGDLAGVVIGIIVSFMLVIGCIVVAIKYRHSSTVVVDDHSAANSGIQV